MWTPEKNIPSRRCFVRAWGTSQQDRWDAGLIFTSAALWGDNETRLILTSQTGAPLAPPRQVRRRRVGGGHSRAFPACAPASQSMPVPCLSLRARGAVSKVTPLWGELATWSLDGVEEEGEQRRGCWWIVRKRPSACSTACVSSVSRSSPTPQLHPRAERLPVVSECIWCLIWSSWSG